MKVITTAGCDGVALPQRRTRHVTIWPATAPLAVYDARWEAPLTIDGATSFPAIHEEDDDDNG